MGGANGGGIQKRCIVRASGGANNKHRPSLGNGDTIGKDLCILIMIYINFPVAQG